MQPFVDIAIRPAYGKHKAVVTWKVQERFRLGDFYIYKSETGNHDWELVSGEAPLKGTEWSDPKANSSAFYRLLLEFEGESYDSPVVGMYDKLTKAEYRAVRKIMNIEYENMTRGRQGLRMLLFTPLTSGVLAPDVDPQTGQRYGTGVPEDPALDSYGERFVGGFAPPTITYVKLSTMAQLTVADAPDKSTTTYERAYTTRMLAYPLPQRGDLLVHPETDKRYIIGEQTQAYYFRGVIPTAFDIPISELYHSDPRYRVPIPILEPELRTA
jgi:hypothetical protein